MPDHPRLAHATQAASIGNLIPTLVGAAALEDHMRVKHLRDWHGRFDRTDPAGMVRSFRRGTIEDVPEEEVYGEHGCIRAGLTMTPPRVMLLEEKNLGEAPENRALGRAPEDRKFPEAVEQPKSSGVRGGRTKPRPVTTKTVPKRRGATARRK